MASRIIGLQCPHCKKMIETFVLIGQTFTETCELCNKKIYFDESGNIYAKMSKKTLKEMEKRRDAYYDELAKRYT